MPQSFHVLRCYKCLTFQVDIVKKANKWQCKVCGDKQSIKKVFCTGTGLECRSVVQQLNLQIGQASQLAEQAALDDFHHLPTVTHPVDDYNHPREQFPTNDQGCVQSQSPASRWAAFLPPEACSQSQSKPNPTNFVHASTASDNSLPNLSSTFAAKRTFNSSQSFPKPSTSNKLNPVKRPKIDLHPNLDSISFQSKSSSSNLFEPKQPTPKIPDTKVMKLPSKSNATNSKIHDSFPKIQPPKSFSTDFAKRYFQPLQNITLPYKLPPKPAIPEPSPPFKDNIPNFSSSTQKMSPEWSDHQNQKSSPETSTASSSRWTKFLPKNSEDFE